ncbi:sodium-dependent glucose transporter 1A isoform X1 [Parasteatoda tepidariorum]|uniref:sodium-dependent glucose transporter 1A isoform X1 n=2 Tax=Parasteatoda tepidariorum TaxID=114398 RepID=UPI001C725A72|nr:sodium-dependent glucose transporter 1A isoform X1 [Parasteatoda tepidariorum]
MNIQHSITTEKMFHLKGKTLDYVGTAVHYYMYAILGLMMSIPGPTLIDLTHSSGTDAYGISFIYVARATGYLVGSLSGGIILDCLKTKELAMICSSLFIALGAFVIPFCRSLPMLLGTFVITGFAIGFSNTGCNASCLRIWGKKSAPVLQGLHLLYGCGAFLAPVLAAPFLDDSLNAPLKELNATVTPNVTFLNITVDKVEIVATVPTITWVYMIAGVLATFVTCFFILIVLFLPPKNASSEKASESENVRNPGYLFTSIVVALACILTGLSSGIEVSFTQMITTYVVNSSHGLSKSKGSYITSAYWSAFTTARFLSIFLTCKLDIRKILACSLVLSVSAAIVLLTFGNISVTSLWVGGAMLGVSMAPLFPGVLAWVERYININSRIASVFTLVSCVLEMVVPLTISMYLSTYPNVLFVFLTGATSLAAILFVIIHIILIRKGEKYEAHPEQQVQEKEATV